MKLQVKTPILKSQLCNRILDLRLRVQVKFASCQFLLLLLLNIINHPMAGELFSPQTFLRLVILKVVVINHCLKETSLIV